MLGGKFPARKIKKTITKKPFDIKFQTFNSQEAMREDLRNFLLINFVKLKDSVFYNQNEFVETQQAELANLQ